MKLHLYTIVLAVSVILLSCSSPTDPLERYDFADITISDSSERDQILPGNPVKFEFEITLPHLFETIRYSFAVHDSSLQFDNTTVRERETVSFFTTFQEGGTYNVVISGILKDGNNISDSVEITVSDVFTITYTSTDHSSGTVPKDSLRYTTGEPIEIRDNTGDLQRTGYTFTGWQKADASKIYSGGDTLIVNNVNVELSPVWEATSNTITFHSNDENDRKKQQAAITDEILKLRENDFQREEYIFTGWAVNPESDSVAFTDREEITMIAGDMNLYAVWSLSSFTITFDKNSSIATGSMDPQLVLNDETVALNQNSFNKDDWTFLGWSTSPDGNETIYDDGSEYRIDGSDITLYAIWSPNPVMVSCGDRYSLVLLSDGSLWASGYNHNRQLGDFSETHSFVLVKDDVHYASAGNSRMLIITTGGDLWTTMDDEYLLVAREIKHVAGNSSFIIAVREDGRVLAQGSNIFGQLGMGHYDRANSFGLIPNLADIVEVAVGLGHTMFLDKNGYLWAAGSNVYGKLGLGNESGSNTPVLVDSNVVSVKCQNHHSVLLKSHGQVKVTGQNTNYQLGGESATGYSNFTELGVTGLFEHIATSSFNTMFIRTDGRLMAVGQNSSGQLGSGVSGDVQHNPASVAENVTFVSTYGTGVGTDDSDSHTMIIKEDGTLWATGSNRNGQFGNGTTESTNEFIQIPLDFFNP
ncbi:InlB B-repeat-containing protein [Chitinispirillales bacterium ANBcel5]|uniref:InlB B-repeat-containing protein n=1 Tax=Cellulosispirillum alkaliphilum TaxID=3039283 RepID=UPI002A57B17D|nr:InlB B-repeat-containing protein [Chitinispirillales bacterium ANBcel5]